MARRFGVQSRQQAADERQVHGKKKGIRSSSKDRPARCSVDYKDIESLKKSCNRQGKIISRRKSGCTAVSQHAVTRAIKPRARFMALLPYTGE